VAFDLKLEDGVGMVISSKGYRFTNREGMTGRYDDVNALGQTMRTEASSEYQPDQMEKCSWARPRVAELPFKRRTLSIAAAGEQHKKPMHLNERNLSLYESH
jgi:hypothetical protein